MGKEEGRGKVKIGEREGGRTFISFHLEVGCLPSKLERTKLIGWPWVEQRCRWRMGRMNVTPSKFCMEIADLYLQVDEAVKRAVLS